MKIFITTIALLLAGLVFIAPPLIAALPVLVVAVLLVSSPALMRSTGHRDRTPEDDAGHTSRA